MYGKACTIGVFMPASAFPDDVFDGIDSKNAGGDCNHQTTEKPLSFADPSLTRVKALAGDGLRGRFHCGSIVLQHRFIKPLRMNCRAKGQNPLQHCQSIVPRVVMDHYTWCEQVDG